MYSNALGKKGEREKTEAEVGGRRKIETKTVAGEREGIG
jgi:hypothetical protein